MKEFIEKLIGRLEEKRYKAEMWSDSDDDYFSGKEYAYDNSMIIVNQLAEEYKDNVMINEQYCWQICGATEHCKECNRLCNGSIDYYENYDVLAEEYNNDFCEWKEKGNYYVTECLNETGVMYNIKPNFIFCPYCGKKIKVAPYQPKGE